MDGASIEEKLINKTVYSLDYYSKDSKDENDARAKRILSGFRYFNILTPTKVTVA